MLRCITVLLLLLAGPVLAQNRPAPPDGPAELYFLSVGIGEYGLDTANADMPQAEASAELVAQALLAVGARHGIVLRSRASEDQFGQIVGRGDIMQALFDLKRRIRADAPVAPRIVVYMMGHGYGDPAVNVMFLAPGDLVLGSEALRQTEITHLVQTSIWNSDVLSALVNFRTHPSMSHFDDFLPSQIMPDLNNPMSGLAVARRAAEMAEIDERLRSEGAYAPDGNPPVPYLLMFDNCFGSIEQDLVFDAGWFGRRLERQFSQIMDEGRVYYAAEPGRLARPIPAPAGVVTEWDLGPVAARFLEVLQTAPRAATLADLDDQMRARRAQATLPDWAPYSHDGDLLADVAGVAFLPRWPDQTGTLERRYGTLRKE